MTARISRVCSAFMVVTPTAVTVPVPRTFAVIVPLVTYCVATSGRLRFIQVLEKKVSTSSTDRKIIDTFLTQSRFFGFASMDPYPFTLPELAIPSTRYSSPCRNRRSEGIIYTVAIAKARPISPALICERKTDSGC